MALARILTAKGVQAARVDIHRGNAAQATPLDLQAAGLSNLSELLSHPELTVLAQQIPSDGPGIALDQVNWLAPIDDQEVWAAGVTYKRSQTARMEESEAAASCYDRVYTAARPEIFFKATPGRCSGHLGMLRIREDAHWNVPEPELALVISSSGKIVGYTIGNDMSSRDIEGDNPLYLPQAKLYNQCCGLGPWITLAGDMPERQSIEISLAIHRDDAIVFEGKTSVAQMARKLEDLVEWLLRDNDMHQGAFLLTGTGVVPDSNFTLQRGDIVDISISGIGTLTNTIVQG
ncbi:MAG: fumarylacetoacetate hydrolase family protein [Pirellula sp.]|nr:fumarylacetoacetate hydrolase family protein [Planctomycetota bacterium]